MTDKREELLRSTNDAHGELFRANCELQDIARDVHYLHPNLADDLLRLSHQIEKASKTIRGDAAEILNMDLAESRKHMGEVFTAVLDRASPPKKVSHRAAPPVPTGW